MRLYLSDGFRLRPRVSERVMWGAPCSGCDAGAGRVSRFVSGVFGYFIGSLIVFLVRPRECGGGWVVCCCEVVVCASRGAGSVAVY